MLREDASPPDGCTMTTIGSSCAVYMQLKGLVDIPKEVARLEESIEKRSTQRAKLVKMTEAEGYEEKVKCLWIENEGIYLFSLGTKGCENSQPRKGIYYSFVTDKLLMFCSAYRYRVLMLRLKT